MSQRELWTLMDIPLRRLRYTGPLVKRSKNEPIQLGIIDDSLDTVDYSVANEYRRRLQHLSIRCSEGAEVAFRNLLGHNSHDRQFTELEGLRILGRHERDFQSFVGIGFPKLRSLTVHGVVITERINAERLEYLNVSDVSFDFDGRPLCHLLGSFPHLNTLSLGNIRDFSFSEEEGTVDTVVLPELRKLEIGGIIRTPLANILLCFVAPNLQSFKFYALKDETDDVGFQAASWRDQFREMASTR